MDERDCKYSACSVTFKRFLDLVDAAGIKTHIMAGIIPLKAAGMAKYMNENVPGIDVPQDMIDRLAAAAAEGKEKGIKGLPMQLGIEMAAFTTSISATAYISWPSARKRTSPRFWTRPGSEFNLSYISGASNMPEFDTI